MIRYALRCAEGHAFDSWFADAAAYDKLRARDLVVCEACDSTEVEKALMAPRVAPARRRQEAETSPKSTAPAPAAPAVPDGSIAGGPKLALSKLETAVAEMRAKVEAESTYVGKGFAAEARAMHEGERPEAPIWGEATADEAKTLREDGIPALPLPFGPKAKAN